MKREHHGSANKKHNVGNTLIPTIIYSLTYKHTFYIYIYLLNKLSNDCITITPHILNNWFFFITICSSLHLMTLKSDLAGLPQKLIQYKQRGAWIIWKPFFFLTNSTSCNNGGQIYHAWTHVWCYQRIECVSRRKFSCCRRTRKYALNDINSSHNTY